MGGSAKFIAKSKGVHREVESEESFEANDWPDVQEPYRAFPGG